MTVFLGVYGVFHPLPMLFIGTSPCILVLMLPAQYKYAPFFLSAFLSHMCSIVLLHFDISDT